MTKSLFFIALLIVSISSYADHYVECPNIPSQATLQNNASVKGWRVLLQSMSSTQFKKYTTLDVDNYGKQLECNFEGTPGNGKVVKNSNYISCQPSGNRGFSCK